MYRIPGPPTPRTDLIEAIMVSFFIGVGIALAGLIGWGILEAIL